MANVKSYLRILTAISFIACVAGTGWAQSYPQNPIRLIVPSSPGGGADTVARILANALPPILGQRVIVDNRAGASGNIGAAAAAQASADGYTWLSINNAQAANASLHSKLPYNLLRDFVPVTQIDAAPHVIVVHPSLPAQTVAELVTLAKAQPDKFDYASAGTGTVTHLAAEIFKDQAGVDMTHVPYKGGGESLRSVLAGETPVYFSPLQVALPHIREGRLRALAVTSESRIPLLPEVPTVAESGYPAYKFNLWNGLLMPAGTPKDIVVVVHGAVVKALRTPEVTKRLEDIGSIIVAGEPEEFGAFLKFEVDTLANLITKLKLKVE
jgi:tripartite-type tricarboxylate transporter receptor subunit TctC